MTDATNFAGDKDDYYDANKRLAKILQEVKDERDRYRQALERICAVAIEHDSGERQYGMSDWDFVVKQCQRELSPAVCTGDKP